MSNYNFKSITKFSTQVRDKLKNRIAQVLFNKKEEMRGTVVKPVSEANKSTGFQGDGFQYATVLKGGSIGGKNIRSPSDLKGMSVKGNKYIKASKAEAKVDAARLNKSLSPGEKDYYKMKYIVVQVREDKYTGK